MADVIDLPAGTEPVSPPKPSPAPSPPPDREQWRKDRNGREFVGKGPGQGKGNVYRLGDETVEQARARTIADRAARDAGETRPRRKTKVPKLQEAPREVDLKELEASLVEALKAPAMVSAMFGDEWAAEHFTRSAPYLARNVIRAAEHNPWLRKRLEQAATGEEAMMIVVSLVGVAGGLVMYLVPPLVWWFNLPVSPKTRELLGVPRRDRVNPADARTPPPTAQDAASAGEPPPAAPGPGEPVEPDVAAEDPSEPVELDGVPAEFSAV